MKYWLLKSEPDVYSIEHMEKDKTTWWDHIRNYQARNYMTQEMRPGDLAFFYHSNAQPSGVAGVVEISKPAVADASQFDSSSEYFDYKSTLEKPRWFCVQVRFREKFKNLVSLDEIKRAKVLSKMVLLNNSRLSVQPVTKSEFDTIIKLGKS